MTGVLVNRLEGGRPTTPQHSRQRRRKQHARTSGESTCHYHSFTTAQPNGCAVRAPGVVHKRGPWTNTSGRWQGGVGRSGHHSQTARRCTRQCNATGEQGLLTMDTAGRVPHNSAFPCINTAVSLDRRVGTVASKAQVSCKLHTTPSPVVNRRAQ